MFQTTVYSLQVPQLLDCTLWLYYVSSSCRGDEHYPDGFLMRGVNTLGAFLLCCCCGGLCQVLADNVADSWMLLPVLVFFFTPGFLTNLGCLYAGLVVPALNSIKVHYSYHCCSCRCASGCVVVVFSASGVTSSIATLYSLWRCCFFLYAAVASDPSRALPCGALPCYAMLCYAMLCIRACNANVFLCRRRLLRDAHTAAWHKWRDTAIVLQNSYR